MNIPAENTGGDCFVEAVNNAMADNSLYVVHGIVHGQGALEGLVFPHAWNETDDGYVIDTSNGHDICMPSSAYYAIGRIDSADVRKYDYQQMAQEVVRTGTYGPWDDMLDFDYKVIGAMKKNYEGSSIDERRVAMRRNAQSSMREVALNALREVRADSLADVRDKLVDSRFWSFSDLENAILRAGLVIDDTRSGGSNIVAFDWSGNGYVIQVDSFDDGEFGSVYEVVRVLSD